MRFARAASLIARTTVAMPRMLASRTLPNLILATFVLIVIAWYQIGLVHEIERHGGRRAVNYVAHDSFPHLLIASYRWLYGFPVIGTMLVGDLVLISLFARRWRARRWGRKPAEIERATRYFMG